MLVTVFLYIFFYYFFYIHVSLKNFDNFTNFCKNQFEFLKNSKFLVTVEKVVKFYQVPSCNIKKIDLLLITSKIKLVTIDESNKMYLHLFYTHHIKKK